MITITRRLASQLQSVIRRACGSRGIGPAVGFIADKEGLTVKCASADAAIEYRVPGALPVETLWLPMQALDDFAGKKDDPVELEASGKGHATAQWRDGNVPQIISYDSAPPRDTDKFPMLPTDFATNPPGLLQALHEASEVTNPNNSRYATGCLQLCPDGSINATDGHQALIQSGFAFNWSKPLLVPHSKVFRAPEVPQDKPVAVAQSGDWLAIAVDPWTIFLRIDTDGRFPDMAKVIPDPANATARCQLSEDDARFLADTLPRLPCCDEQNLPVTLDLNGHVAIRATADDNAAPTEVVLTNSRCSGEPIRINTNRNYLSRAMRLGLRELCLFGDQVSLLGQTDNRRLVWMPLEPGSAIKPVAGCIRIESPKAGTSAAASTSTSPSSKSKTERKAQPVRESTTNTNGKATTSGQAKSDTTGPKAPRRKAGQQDITTLIERALKFRTALHDQMHEAGELVKALKQHRRQSKAIQNALTSISQVKSLI